MNTDTAINSNTNKKDEHELSGIKFIQTDNKIISSSYLFLKDKSFGNSYYYQIFEKSEDRTKDVFTVSHGRISPKRTGVKTSWCYDVIDAKI